MYRWHSANQRDLWVRAPGIPESGCGRKRPPVPEVRSPTVRRRELGALLRALRQEQGLTVEQVAAQLLCSPSKVSRMETGHRGATARDIRDLCGIYGVSDPAERSRMARLAAEGKEQGWWQSYDLDYFATYVGLEEAATAMRQFQSTVIPGLLQTPAYAKAMAEVLIPEVSPTRVDELVEVKLRRQSLLSKTPRVMLSVILDEAVLHRLVGGPVAMRAQLEHLIDVTKIHNVTIQVIPYETGAHAAMESTFSILDFGEPVPSIVYVEGLVGFIYIERQQDIARYERVFEQLCDIALSPQESIKLIAKVGTGYGRASTGAMGSERIA
jgi:transcriptional regulator with XRE-family HTH domain